MKLVGTKWAQPFGDGKASDNIVDDLVELSESNSFHKHNKQNYPFDISNSFNQFYEHEKLYRNKGYKSFKLKALFNKFIFNHK